MGADFMLYCCEDPTDYKKAMPLIKYRIDNLSNNDLDGLAKDALWHEASEIQADEEAECTLKEEDLWKLNDLTSIKIRDMVKEKIKAAAEELFGAGSYRRDVASMRLGEIYYLMTGGMSWGDLPTEACDLICLIENSAVTDGMGRLDFDYESLKA